MTTDD